jgi:hypothetical protein
MEIWVSEECLHVRTDPLGLPARLRVWAGEAFIGETLAKGDGALAVPKALVPLKVAVWEMSCEPLGDGPQGLAHAVVEAGPGLLRRTSPFHWWPGGC